MMRFNSDRRNVHEDAADSTPESTTHTVSRRTVLRGGGAVAGGAAAGLLLSACGSGSDDDTGSGSTGSSESGGGATSSGGSGGGSKSLAGEKLTLWWAAGLSESEDKGMQDLVDAFEKKTGASVDLQFYPQDSLATKLASALVAGNPPDAAYALHAPSARYAYNDKLASVADVINNSDLLPAAAQSAKHLNGSTGKTDAYTVPIVTQLTPMFLWSDMLESIGSDPQNLPTGWDDFWNLAKKVQKDYLSDSGKAVTAIGWTLSPSNGDTENMFTQAVTGYGGEFLKSDGSLNLDDKALHTAIGDALEFLKKLYDDGNIPKGSLSWDGAGNNNAFLNRSVFCTPNGSLSIPGSLKDKDPDTWKKVLTTAWPNRVDGSAFPQLVRVFSGCVFKGKNEEAGRAFFEFYSRPEEQNKWLIAGNGRYTPTTAAALSDPFWAKSDDPNVQFVVKALKGTATVDPYSSNGAYKDALDGHLWGRTEGEVLVKGTSISDAVDGAIKQLKQTVDDFGK